MTKLLETIDLVTHFYTYEGVVKALNKVSLVVDHGSTFGLVGESGCGKSVTVRSIMRIVPEPGCIEGGKVIVYLNEKNKADGIDLLQQSETYMQRLRGERISMIFQEPNAALNPTMSIGDQIAESFLFHQKKQMCGKILKDLESPTCRTVSPLKQLQQALYRTAARRPDALIIRLLNRIPLLRFWQRRLKNEARARAVEIIAKLGIPNPKNIIQQYPHHLSCSPVLLIADEATSNLDVTIQAQILELLRRLKQEEISSVLLITHDLGVVAETCDRHPYSRALLAAVPKFSMEDELKSIEGNVPNLVTPPSGCRFHPRCPHAMAVCKEAFPEMTEIEQNHLVACYWAASKYR
jgi:peptide/nickel transport system ATP-binding protein